MSWLTFVSYMKYLLRHKYAVYKACRILGVGIYQSLAHDWTKFKYSEYWPYAKYFYGVLKNSPLVQEVLKGDFDYAWNYHQKHNRHHWQYWVLIKDDGTLKPLKIPDHYVREMVADWIGAGQCLNPDSNVKVWYEANKNKLLLHPDTRSEIESLITEYLGKNDSDSKK